MPFVAFIYFIVQLFNLFYTIMKKEIVLIMFASLLFNVLSIICLYKMCVRQDVARAYINELEEQIGDNLMDTVGSGDAYANYYNY